MQYFAPPLASDNKQHVDVFSEELSPITTKGTVGATWEQVRGSGGKWEQRGSKWEQVGGSGGKWKQVGASGSKWEQVEACSHLLPHTHCVLWQHIVCSINVKSKQGLPNQHPAPTSSHTLYTKH